MSERLALGTVQFGMNYGVAAGSKVPIAEVERILSIAERAGIDTLDTAEDYGSAEVVLGRAGVSAFKVVGKVGQLQRAEDLCRRAEACLSRLRLEQFEAVLLHVPTQMIEEPRIAQALFGLKRAGLAQAVGFSVYTPEELSLLMQLMTPDLVQLPLSALDSRWDAVLPDLAAQNVRVHLRSAYLQGLLTLPATPGWAMRWNPLLAAWREWVALQSTTPARAALALALARPVERVIIGVDNARQLTEVLHLPKLPPLPSHLATNNPELLDPRYWLVT